MSWSSRKIDNNPNIYSSEKKLGSSNKYDRMLESLEAAATKQRKPNENNGSAKKAGASTKATQDIQDGQHMDTRTAALSISSCISKNTGSNTALAREKLSQLHAFQQHQQQMLYAKHSIFDRNRPWNCEYCQPKNSPLPAVDNKVKGFGRKLIAEMVARFMIKEEFYESRKVVELLNTNSRSVLVAMFKDYLIFDDIYEFLTSMYDLDSCMDILTRHAIFYDSLSSFEVLCQYREEQIRDRHLVLHGLKPCYIGLEKQIQSIIASNLKNKLRLMLNKVRKIQIARGLYSEHQSKQDQDSEQSQFSTPARDLIFKSARKTATGSKQKKDFKKLIQTTLVMEYNFSRSQSGLLVPKEQQQFTSGIVGQDGMVMQHQNTNSSINFTNISFDGEVELLKGSVFDDSLERHNLQATPLIQVENIESKYMNAQLILDDLSSRPLTRQSMPITNIATPASRIQLYELQLLQLQKEEQRTRLPFNSAPEKPLDQKSCTDSQTDSGLMHASYQEQIVIVNQDFASQKGNHPGDPMLVGPSSMFNNEVPVNSIRSQTMARKFEKKIAFKPFTVPSDDQSLHQSIHSVESSELLPQASSTQGQGQARLSEESKAAIRHGRKLTNFGPGKSKKSQHKLGSSDYMKGHQRPSFNGHSSGSRKRKGINQKANEHSQNRTSAQTSNKSFKQNLVKINDANQVVPPTSINKSGRKSKKVGKVASRDYNQRLQGTPCSDDKISSNMISNNSVTALKSGGQSASNAPHQISHVKKRSMGKNSTFATASQLKSSPTNRHQFTLSQNKVITQSSRAPVQPVASAQSSFKAAHFLAKKGSMPVSHLKKLQQNEDTGGQSTREHEANQAVFEENSDKIKVSKKLIASLKSQMQMSPNKAQRMQTLVERDDYSKLAQSMGAPKQSITGGKGLTPAKTLGSLVTIRSPQNALVTQSTCQIQTSASRQQHYNATATTSQTVAKTLKRSGIKRNEEKQAKTSNTRKHMASTQSAGCNAMSLNDKPSKVKMQSSLDNKLQKQSQHLSLKEQVILEAIRNQPNLVGQVQHRSTQSASSQQQMLVQGGNAAQYDAQAIKLLRSQQMTASSGILTQSKTMVAQKIDLYSIAGKLKLLNAQQQLQGNKQRQVSSTHRKNSIKFSSRKVSIEPKEDLLFAQKSPKSNAQIDKQQAQRFFSADGFSNEDIAEQHQSSLAQRQQILDQNPGKCIKEKQPTSKTAANSKRKLIPTSQQLESPYYTQRSKNNQTRAMIVSPSHKLHGGQPITSRNQLNLLENASSTDYNKHGQSQQQLVHTKSLVDTNQLRDSVRRSNNVVQTKQLQSQSKKKISKLSRASANFDTTQGATLSPRKVLKESATVATEIQGKTRNQNFISGSFTTTSQQRLLNAGGLSLNKKASQLTLTSPKPGLNRQALLVHSSASNFEQHKATAAAINNQTSRNNNGLQQFTGMHQSQHNQVNSVLHELSSPKASSIKQHSIQGVGSKMLQSHQSLQQIAGSNPTTFITVSMPQVTNTTALKQELKLHSRKNSAIYTSQVAPAKGNSGLQNAAAQIGSTQKTVGAPTGSNVLKKTKKKQQ